MSRKRTDDIQALARRAAGGDLAAARRLVAVLEASGTKTAREWLEEAGFIEPDEGFPQAVAAAAVVELVEAWRDRRLRGNWWGSEMGDDVDRASSACVKAFQRLRWITQYVSRYVEDGPGARLPFAGERPIVDPEAPPGDMVFMPPRFSIAEFQSMPVLSQGQFDNLMWESNGWRVWLSRMGVEDGARWDDGVMVERLVDGRWENYEEYQAR